MASSSKADRKDAVSAHEYGGKGGLLPVMMMSMLVQQRQRDKSRRKARARGKEWGSLGGSSDDDDVENLKDSGMKSVVALQKLHRRVKRHPKRVIAEFAGRARGCRRPGLEHSRLVAADPVEQAQGLAAMCCYDSSGIRAGPSRASRCSLLSTGSELEKHPSVL